MKGCGCPINGTWIMCGEGGNYCTAACYEGERDALVEFLTGGLKKATVIPEDVPEDDRPTLPWYPSAELLAAP